MQFGLTGRVVATVVLLAVSVVAIDALVTRWAFEKRFLDYVAEQERELLEDLAGALAREHMEEGDLEALVDRSALFRFLGRALLGDRLARERLRRLEDALEDERPPAPHRGGDRDEDRPAGARPPRREDAEDRRRAGRHLERELQRRLGSFLPRLRITLADERALLEPRRAPPPDAR
ncbi:MAG: hypothetical protein V2J24_04180, partial [Pseudomonadales bacterium]|nr:hypothetical protein [Pseudomonadales bacterium]